METMSAKLKPTISTSLDPPPLLNSTLSQSEFNSLQFMANPKNCKEQPVLGNMQPHLRLMLEIMMLDTPCKNYIAHVISVKV